MAIQIELWTHKPFYIAAVQVTDKNMREVSSWCNGSYVKVEEDGRRYISLSQEDVLNSRVKAYAGDWVCQTSRDGKNFKIYNDAIFKATFERKEDESDSSGRV